jgi:UDP-GlcNAc3NAcA epimerase
MKILTVLGARPQFIKASVVSKEIIKIREQGQKIEEVIVHTGQHYDYNMSDIFLEELELPIKYHLGIREKSHGAMTGKMIIKLEEVMLKEKPNVVLVYGDTNSTLAGAIAASKLNIKIAHVEAGLRSFNNKMPEEINRIITDRLSKWLFCPTQTAVENLKKEGFQNFDCKILKVGDVMYDSALYYKKYSKIPKSLQSYLSNSNNFMLCTIHRAENTDNIQNLKNILSALEEISKEIDVVLPLHPRTKKILKKNKIKTKNIIITNPVSYLEMLWLLDNCKMIITDSGGLQKEAFFFKKPCIILREETEWIELVENKFSALAGTKKERIIETIKNFEFSKNWSLNLFGDGKASKKIIEELLKL